MFQTGKFDELYEKLNPAQKEAVDAIEGPVMVIAGPGTGKTQILTLRVANILKQTDVQPENILALTFTESASISMRRRLVDIIGSAAYSVEISTFHGFCNDIIKSYPEEFPRIIGSQNITEAVQVRLIESMIEKLQLDVLKPFGAPFHYLRAILADINKLKQEGVTADEFIAMARIERKEFDAIDGKFHDRGAHKGKMKGEYQTEEKRLRKNEELLKVYKEYQKELARAGYYDWSDMIMETYGALKKNGELLLMLQERHQYILVDEHQDTNNAQNKIVELLASFHPSPNLFVVGDEKQAIYRFQGASLENFLYFKNRYADAKLVTLEDNYRSTQCILDSAGCLLEGDKKLKSNTKNSEENIKLYSFSRPEVENIFLAKDIKEKITAGVPPHEIAVIYRDNRDAFPPARVFEKFKIPFAIESDEDVLEDVDIKKFLLLFRAIAGFGKAESALEAMHVDFLDIPPLDVYKVIETVGSGKESFASLMVQMDKEKESAFDALDLSRPKSVNDFFVKLSRWRVASKNKDTVSLFELVARESGFLGSILSLPDSVEKMDKLLALFDELKSLAETHKNISLSGFLEYIDALSKHRVSIKKSGARHITERVRFMTAHRAKGLEFDYVYIINAYDGHWGNRRKPDILPLIPRVFSLFGNVGEKNGGSETDDERRLFYVAITRAKKGVSISYSRVDSSGREKIPSQFVSEIKPELILKADESPYEESYSGNREILFSEPFVSGVNVKNREFVKDVFMRRGLSVTGLNNYLVCPWKYFYTNLIRIPKAKSREQLYGTAIHNALRDLFENMKKREVRKEFLLQRFEFYLRRMPLSESDFIETLAKGVKSLGGYYDKYADEWGKTNVLSEFSVSGVFLDDRETRLTGTLDKIEIMDGGTANFDNRPRVNVVDYKTGRPKSRGKIEGAPRDTSGDSGEEDLTEGNIKRQLVFYKLLLSLYKEGKKFDMVSGEIDFVEPDEKGRYKKEKFEISDKEVDELKNLVRKVSGDILGLCFWNSFCGDEKCEFCELRKMMTQP